MKLAARVATALRDYRFTTTSEAVLQGGIFAALLGEGFAVEREWRITKGDRIDFVVVEGPERVGVECTIKGTVPSVLRQLHRYASAESITSLVLVTTLSRHAPPEEILGKPVLVVNVGGAFL